MQLRDYPAETVTPPIAAGVTGGRSDTRTRGLIQPDPPSLPQCPPPPPTPRVLGTPPSPRALITQR